MQDLDVLQKDPLWSKACELSRSLLSIIHLSESFSVALPMSSMEVSVRSLPRAVAEASLAVHSGIQAERLEAALEQAREVDRALHGFAEMVLAADPGLDYKPLGRCVLESFALADQLREMIFLARKDLLQLRKTA